MLSICRLCLSSRIERYAQEHGNYKENWFESWYVHCEGSCW